MGIDASRSLVRRAFDTVYGGLLGREALKRFHEFRYWRLRSSEEGVLGNGWYRYYYTDYFGIPVSHYAGARILDVGCGPRGSLEWATMAFRRVGLDPLAGRYRRLGIDAHAMEYVEAHSEAMPFADDTFDVVMSMNSLDHVVDACRTAAEMVRVVRPGGTILLLVDLDHEPTQCEPLSFGIEVLDYFCGCTVQWSQRLESPEKLRSWDVPFDVTDSRPRPSGVAARLTAGAASAQDTP